MRSGFFRESRHFTTLAKENFKLGFNSSRAGSDDCWDLYDATSVPHFPMNSTEERKIMANFNARVDELMRLDDIFCPRINAMSSVFSIAYYWDGVDYRQEYSKWVQLKMKVFPELATRLPCSNTNRAAIIFPVLKVERVKSLSRKGKSKLESFLLSSNQILVFGATLATWFVVYRRIRVWTSPWYTTRVYRSPRRTKPCR